MPETRQPTPLPPPQPDRPVTRLPLPGPTNVPLTDRERIDWHDHAEHQLIHPSQGLLHVSTPLGVWVVPPLRAVWIPAGVPHSHQAQGPTRMRTLSFPASVNPLRVDQPTVLAVGPLLREVIVTLTEGVTAAARSGDDLSDDDRSGNDRSGSDLSPDERANLLRVALDRLLRVDTLPLHLPAPTDGRLRDVAALLHRDPSDGRTLAELGAEVGAGERTLSRLFRQQTGMTFPQWRTQLRLHHALGLLAAGTPVTSVAVRCGYANPSAFIEAFRHAFGTTPGRYWQV